MAAIRAADLDSYIECGEELNKPVTFDTETIDVDDDGPEELMITVHHADGGAGCFSHIGLKKVLMMNNRQGEWIPNLGFDAQGPKFLPDRSEGYCDIEVDALQACRPVWRFNGTR
ncbi:hypothetical protein [Microvirga soli]|uniref:hypothetical protein n=1 Tax=Microvirga soli TaxID=1854496 RepID=UPI00191DB003|nr:hypothetical protein [Microvirga soli]